MKFATSTDLMIPPQTTTIESQAFADISSGIKVYIPSSVKTIGRDAFDNVEDLTIYGEIGSYAETFARENSIAFEVTGEME